jgi:hypothetical protein
MFWSRKVVALVAPLLLLGGFSALGAQSAAATSNVRKVKFAGTQDLGSVTANQSKAKVTITCNAATGALNIQAKNISAVGYAEHTTGSWVHGGLVALQDIHGLPNLSFETNHLEAGWVVALHQGPNLLFGGSYATTLANPSDCLRGGFIAIGDLNGVYYQSGAFS